MPAATVPAPPDAWVGSWGGAARLRGRQLGPVTATVTMVIHVMDGFCHSLRGLRGLRLK